jgi:hypothetical protein
LESQNDFGVDPEIHNSFGQLGKSDKVFAKYNSKSNFFLEVTMPI